MNGGGAKQARPCGQCAVGQSLAYNLSRTKKILAITAIAQTTTVISSFLSSPSALGFGIFTYTLKSTIKQIKRQKYRSCNHQLVFEGQSSKVTDF